MSFINKLIFKLENCFSQIQKKKIFNTDGFNERITILYLILIRKDNKDVKMGSEVNIKLENRNSICSQLLPEK
jgi:hypothetical protein